MKLGEYKIKRRYPLIQLIADILSAAALAYIGFIIYSTAMDIEQLNAINYTQTSLDFIKWQPLLIWAAGGAVVWAVSIIALFKPRKAPEGLKLNQTSGKKYCEIIDCCICFVRFMLLLMLSEGCYLHMSAVLRREASFPVQLILDAAIILALIVFTRMRLETLYEAQNDDKPSEVIIGD